MNQISRDVRNKVLEKSDLTVADEPAKYETKQENAVFTTEQLASAWINYAEKLKKEDKSAELSVINQPYEQKENFEIVIKLANSIQEGMLERFRNEFVHHLRQSLKNSQIRLLTEIVQGEVKQRIYTSQDKFNYLAQKNPKLLDLKHRLGLEYDY